MLCIVNLKLYIQSAPSQSLSLSLYNNNNNLYNRCYMFVFDFMLKSLSWFKKNSNNKTNKTVSWEKIGAHIILRSRRDKQSAITAQNKKHAICFTLFKSQYHHLQFLWNSRHVNNYLSLLLSLLCESSVRTKVNENGWKKIDVFDKLFCKYTPVLYMRFLFDYLHIYGISWGINFDSIYPLLCSRSCCAVNRVVVVVEREQSAREKHVRMAFTAISRANIILWGE